MTRTITGLESSEAEFLSMMASQNKAIFKLEDAQGFWGDRQQTREALHRLERDGWLHRLERGTNMIIPLEAGVERRWSVQALVIAPHLIDPAAIAYWTALHHWQLTEQIPHTAFVQSTKRKIPSEKVVLNTTFRFVTVRPRKFFGITRGTIDGQPYYVTNREKTLLDAADRPDLSGGILQLAEALQAAVAQDFDWQLLSDYLLRWPVSSPTKRIGFLVEALDLAFAERDQHLDRWKHSLASGIISLEPGVADDAGPIVTRWQMRVNVSGPWLMPRSDD